MPVTATPLKDDFVQYTLQNGNITAKIINLGATLTHLIVPDRTGTPRDIVLGFDNPSDYLGPSNRYFGATVGRVANRIARGKFHLNDTDYSLAINNGPNALHGGLEGFDRRLWDVQVVDEESGVPGITCTLRSEDGDQGYPGTLVVSVTFTLQPDALDIQYSASLASGSTLHTIINLTNHSYFNLSGGIDPTILQHHVHLHAHHYLPKDDTSIPTKDVVEVTTVPSFDFHTAKRTVGANMPDDTGYDHCFVVAGTNMAHLQPAPSLRPAAHIFCPTTGITLEFSTTEPGFQFYTGFYLDGKTKGKTTQPEGFVHVPLSALCLEAQRFPDAVNWEAWRPMVVLAPGEMYTQHTVYRVGVVKDE